MALNLLKSFGETYGLLDLRFVAGLIENRLEEQD